MNEIVRDDLQFAIEKSFPELRNELRKKNSRDKILIFPGVGDKIDFCKISGSERL